MPLGLQTDLIPDSAMKANSYQSGYPPKAGRLNSHVGWCSQHNAYSDYLQIDFGKVMKITRMATQGRYSADQWVKKYILSFSLDGSAFHAYEKGKVIALNSKSDNVASESPNVRR